MVGASSASSSSATLSVPTAKSVPAHADLLLILLRPALLRWMLVRLVRLSLALLVVEDVPGGSGPIAGFYAFSGKPPYFPKGCVEHPQLRYVESPHFSTSISCVLSVRGM
ncbi:hypothetical protein H2248_004541 [Termitomyces sp. 'cryptogamus']|nr:hypothetical protein H2248_004541 [Termitomyces sp. 'cryptogamus']